MKVIIWGCGKYGKQAFYFYNDKFDIVGFVDSDSNKWGTYLFDKIVYSPSILEDFRGKIIIAVKNGYVDIQRVLEKTYGISEVIVFKITEQPLSIQTSLNADFRIDENTIMIYFISGLGNQMFQYALIKNYLNLGKNIIVNIEHYLMQCKRKFVLCDVFKNINLKFGGETHKQEIIDKNKDIYGHKDFRIYVEGRKNGMIKSADMSLLDITGGILYGYFQSYQFAQKVEKELREDFVFGTNGDSKLIKLLNRIQTLNCVSVHIRRGDYLTEENQTIYGGICTQKYYHNAMKIMRNKFESCIFCFFSNEIEWVKEQFNISDAIYIESNMFEDYQDWYDMFLMSQCKHNIIANSTFSWWGAWLNSNKDKVVIAPKIWNNKYKYIDICPEDWITI